jgi:tRNA G18 (ribose-2'-O)-methylase SpoU
MHQPDSATEEQQQQETAQPEASTSGQQHPDCYVIVYNLSKKHNVGTLLRSCTAFGVKEVRTPLPAAAGATATRPVKSVEASIVTHVT